VNLGSRSSDMIVALKRARLFSGSGVLGVGA
jgi:hypothetical protein